MLALRRLHLPLAALLAAAGLAACGGDPPPTATGSGGFPTSYTLPGQRTFPEGIAVQKETGDFFVGSTSDGTIYRGNVRKGEAEVFLPGGRDGRTAVTGMKVDPQGRLWVAGRFTGQAFVYDVASRRLLERYDAPPAGPSFSPRRERSLVNDMTLTEDAVYVTDSFRPVVYRITKTAEAVGAEMEPWLDLRDTVVPYRRGFNLNGISSSDDGRFLIAGHTDTGELFRIDTRTRAVREVDLGGATLKTADGLLLDGRSLLVVREEPGEVVPVKLSADGSRGEVGRAFGRSALSFPPTLAERDGRVLVVNSQFDRGDAPELPFTVSGLDLPAGALGGS